MEILKRVLRKDPEKLRLLQNLLETSIDGSRDIFVNRPLNMANIRYIGFDMDYTLAIYHKEAMEGLAFRNTLKKLVEIRGYPEEILALPYEVDQVIRGLLIDHHKGNLVKINRFKQVSRVWHGSQRLKKSTYANERINQSDLQRFASVDTLFSLPEAYLYMHLVDMKEAGKLPERNFTDIYEDVRICIDLTHKDGSLKSEITQNLSKYIYQDPHLSLTLDKFIDSGKKLFLLTNSEFFYTEIVMNFLLDTDNLNQISWRDYFDIIIVNGRKPAFFKDNNPFHLIDENTHTELPVAVTEFEPNKIYSQGNYLAFEKLIQAQGNEILYVGDHIFGDIVRSDKDSNWRTVLVVEELEEEIDKAEQLQEKSKRLRRLTNKRDRLNYEIHLFSSQLNSLKGLKKSIDKFTPQEQRALNQTAQELQTKVERCEKDITKTNTKIAALRREISEVYHPDWGPLFHEKDEISRFGDQVRDYASLYTSRVSNFFFYPTDRYYKSLRDIMPHDRWLELYS